MTAEQSLGSEIKQWLFVALVWSTIGLAVFGLDVAVKYVKRGHYRAVTATLRMRKPIAEPGLVYIGEPVSSLVYRERIPKLLIEYSYVVEGTRHEGSTKLADPHGFRPHWSGARAPGDSFLVFYDPAEPGTSTLWPVVSPQMASNLVVFLSMMALWLVVVVSWSTAVAWSRRFS